MRVILLVIATSVATMGPWRASAAPIYRWCANYEGRDVVTCAYDTFQQCLDTAGGGAGGFCSENPAWRPTPAAPARRKMRRRAQ